jgi:HEAT repeat protein
MNRFRVVGLLVLVGAALSPSPAQGQKAFLGKTAADWSSELDSGDAKARRSAAFALGKLGKSGAAAVPRLKQALRDDKDAKVREAAAFALGEIAKETLKVSDDADLVRTLTNSLGRDPDPLVRRSAAFALGCLGSEASASRGALMAALSESNNPPAVRQNAAWALGRIGSSGVPALQIALKDSDMLVRRDAAASLGNLEPEDARPALAELVACCQQKHTELRRTALKVLVKLVGPEDTKLVAPLKTALQDRDEEVQRQAAFALGNIGGSSAAAAVPVLLDAFRRGDSEVRRQAAAAFRNLGEEARAALPDLMKGLEDTDEEIRANSALALGGIGPAAERAIPALVKHVADEQEKVIVRIEAAMALSGIGASAAAEEAVPTLLAVLGNTKVDTKVRERIVWALRVHQAKLPTFAGVVSTLTKILSEPKVRESRMLRYDCAYMVGMLEGPRAPAAAVDLLYDFLKDDDIVIFVDRSTKVQGSGAETGKGKVTGKDITQGDARVMAVKALSRIGTTRVSQRADIVRQLQALARSPNTAADLRDQAKELLRELGQ